VPDTGGGRLAFLWLQGVGGLCGQYGFFVSAQASAKLSDEVGVLVLWSAEVSLPQRVDGSHQRHGFGNCLRNYIVVGGRVVLECEHQAALGLVCGLYC
jgi:hypothetical protein